MRGGYTGKILLVNLNNGKTTTEQLAEADARNFIGGAGINARLAWGILKAPDDAFSPENSLIFGLGPFVGTLIPGAAKGNVVARSPHPQFIGSSGNGLFGMLKFAGYDHLIITGKAQKPVYLKIFNDRVTLCPADHIWGKDIWEATDVISDEVGYEYDVTCIGPAGENLVQDACMITNKYAAFARTGLGAVLGSKNLKGIAVYGTKSIEVADRKRFIELLNEFYPKFMNQPLFDEWRKIGTMISLESFGKHEGYIYRNCQALIRDEVTEKLPLDGLLQRKIGGIACRSCPIGCKHYLKMSEGHSFALSCAISTVQLSNNYGSDSWADAFAFAELAGRLGLDFFSGGMLVGYAMELYEKGIITKADTGGLALRWGDGEAARELLRMIAHREGFGNILADGFLEAPLKIGKEAEKYSMHSKGLGLIFDLRARIHSTEVFSQFTNMRGQTSNVSVTTAAERTPEQIRRYIKRIGAPDEAAERILAGSADYANYNVGRLSKWTEDMTFIHEALGLCQFQTFQRWGLNIWADLCAALTGIAFTPRDFFRAAENARDVLRALNLRFGATKADDICPDRFFDEPLPAKAGPIAPLNKANWIKLLEDFYDERGWDADGRPNMEKLAKLGVK